MWSYRIWRQRRILKRKKIDDTLWREVYNRLPLLHRLKDEALNRLKEMTILFLHEKSLEGAQGLRLTDSMRLTIALQACLPILHLGLDWYAGWWSVIVYPYPFIAEHEQMDGAGVVHRVRRGLCGESWQRGPVILAWPDVAEGGMIDGHNLVIHEFAHKLDMLNGSANGLPPLHRGMAVERWTEAFTDAFADFRRRIAYGEDTPIDPYAAEEPGEFFAVLSEVYFELPQLLERLYPEVYRQLDAFYRNDSSLLGDARRLADGSSAYTTKKSRIMPRSSCSKL